MKECRHTGTPVFFLFILSFLWVFSSCSYRFYRPDESFPLPGAIRKQTVLSDSMRESSGLQFERGVIWTINDSGGEAVLYAAGTKEGQVQRKLRVEGGMNRDWEALAANEHYFFVADVGNNYASRDTLVIYMLERSRLADSTPGIAPAGMISLCYDENSMSTRKGLSSHDCEAMLAFGDSLYLFSKDWVDQGTSVYSLPARPGHYNLRRKARYEVDFLVTGADVCPAREEVVLVGYRYYMPVVAVYRYMGVPSRIGAGGRARMYPLKAGRQVEGVCYDDTGRCYISSEKAIHKPSLFHLFLPGADQ